MNEPAFPQLDCYVDAKGERPVYTTHNGMTLRDYFAAKAMQTLRIGLDADDDIGIQFNADLDVACRAYQIADAMLKAREQ